MGSKSPVAVRARSPTTPLARDSPAISRLGEMNPPALSLGVVAGSPNSSCGAARRPWPTPRPCCPRRRSRGRGRSARRRSSGHASGDRCSAALIVTLASHQLRRRRSRARLCRRTPAAMSAAPCRRPWRPAAKAMSWPSAGTSLAGGRSVAVALLDRLEVLEVLGHPHQGATSRTLRPSLSMQWSTNLNGWPPTNGKKKVSWSAPGSGDSVG